MLEWNLKCDRIASFHILTGSLCIHYVISGAGGNYATRSLIKVIFTRYYGNEVENNAHGRHERDQKCV
jgi:hypothetical protein